MQWFRETGVRKSPQLRSTSIFCKNLDGDIAPQKIVTESYDI